MVYAAQGEGDKEGSGSVAPNISEALKLPRGVSIESNPPRTNNAFFFSGVSWVSWFSCSGGLEIEPQLHSANERLPFILPHTK